MSVKINNSAGGSVTLDSTTTSNETLTLPTGGGTLSKVSSINDLTDVTVSASDPTVSANPPAVGHLWINTTSGEQYVATDKTTGANVWSNTGEGVGNVVLPPVVTGGTITTVGGYKIHTFTSSGTLTFSRGGAVDYLVVAGGGSGGGAGGGGAGGMFVGTIIASIGATTITIGAGASGPTTNLQGNDGSASSFGTIQTTTGGGGGGMYLAGSPAPGRAGGSGGGGGYRAGAGGSGTSGQGNAGGASTDNVSSPFNCAGGGGAGAVGLSDAGAQSGHGGAGVANDYLGISYIFAGGGGGGMQGSGTAGNGGIGGGGGGARYNNVGTFGNAGTGGLNAGTNGGVNLGGNGGTNTGSGGGGMGISVGTAGSGGSGIVVIRYAV